MSRAHAEPLHGRTLRIIINQGGFDAADRVITGKIGRNRRFSATAFRIDYQNSLHVIDVPTVCLYGRSWLHGGMRKPFGISLTIVHEIVHMIVPHFTIAAMSAIF
jgi:hypothetical protein